MRQARGLQVHPLDLLLLAAPLAVAATAWHWSPAALFCASGLAIVPLARHIGVATEVLAGRLRTAASAAGAQLAVAGGALLIPTVLAATAPVKPLALEELSVMAAAALLLAYGAGLLFSLRTHAHLYMGERAEVMHGPGWSGRRAVVVLLLATIGVAVLSELLVEGVKGVTEGMGWTPMFVGVILVALIGNAAEHASAVTVARRDQMDLSLAIALGSATQIALFVAPVLVLLGLGLQRSIDLLFDAFEVAGVAIAAALANLVIQDGESTWLEGTQLLAVYLVLAVAFFVHP